MLKVNLNYPEYILPQPTNWLLTLIFDISSSLGLKKYREEKSLSLSLEHPELFLVKGKIFSIDQSLLKQSTDQNDLKLPPTVKFKISDWTYQVAENSEILVNVTVQEIKPNPAELLFRKLSGDNQYLLALMAFIIPIAVLLIIYLLLIDFPNPLLFWEAVDRNIRGIIMVSLFILMVIVFIWSQIKFRQSTIAQTYFGVALGTLMWTIPFLWAILSAPPPALANQSPEEVPYLRYLLRNATLFWLTLVGIIPWLTIILKYLGWDLLVSILNKAAEESKK